jgi:hypothetical protein
LPHPRPCSIFSAIKRHPIDQLSRLETFGGTVDLRITSHGFTAADLFGQNQQAPDLTVKVLDTVSGEVAALMQGQ